MNVHDSIYNWLTIKVVTDARPEDEAATETEEMFLQMLKNDHGINEIQYEKADLFYHVSYRDNEDSKSTKYPIELIEVMLKQILAEPEKYKNFPTV